MYFGSGKLLLRLVIAGALASAGLVALTTAPAGAAAVPCQRTFSSGAINLAIPDSTTVSNVIDVPEDGLVVSGVSVGVNIHHQSDADLIVGIESQTQGSATRAFVTLFEQYGGGGDNLLGTVWADDAPNPISWGDAPFTGRFKALRPLAELNGFSGGKYELQVSDMSGPPSGTFNDWTLTLTYKSCDLDSDGVEDHGDSCLGVSAHTATGCPVTTRTLGAKYKAGKFKGVVSSPVSGCKASQTVTIWKLRSGADKKIGTTTTRSDGSYKLKRAKHRGKYYATSARVAVTDVAECPAVQSATFRIR